MSADEESFLLNAKKEELLRHQKHESHGHAHGTGMNLPRTQLIVLGIIAVVGLTIDWSAQGEYGNWIALHSGDAELGGYLISFWAFSQFIIAFPLLLILEYVISKLILKRHVLQIDEQRHGVSFGEWCKAYFWESMQTLQAHSDYTFVRCILVSVALGALFYLSAWTYFLSLALMPAAYNTAAYQSVTVFVFVFSIFLLKESPRFFKVVSVLLCTTGIVLLGVGSSPSESGSVSETGSDDSLYPRIWLGYTLCIFSAGCYALYEVLFAKFFGSQPIRSMFLFLGICGWFVLSCLWPGLLIVDYTGLEQIPDTLNTASIIYLFGNGFLQIGFVGFFLFGISLTGSPLFITIGSMLTIPTTALFDRLVYDIHLSVMSIVGDVLIGVGFILLLPDFYFENFSILKLFKRKDRKSVV